MLIYARCQSMEGAPQSSERRTTSDEIEIPKPPSRALEVVEKINQTYEEECDVFSKECVFPMRYKYAHAYVLPTREDMQNQKFASRRSAVRDIYQSWAASQASQNEVSA